MQATSKCVHILEQWGYLRRIKSRTTLIFYGAGSEGGVASNLKDGVEGGGGGGEPQLPAGMRANTQQARAWLALAHRAGLQGAMDAMAATPAAAAAAGDASAVGRRELARREVETETFDSWAKDAGLDERQFANAVRALAAKGLIRVDRSATLQVRVPAEVREDTGEQLPDRTDERTRALVEKRQRRKAKIRAVEEYMACQTDELGENEALWRFIMRYFGEEPEGGAQG